MSTFLSVQCSQFSAQQLRFDQVDKTDSFSTEMLTNLPYSLTCVSVLQDELPQTEADTRYKCQNFAPKKYSRRRGPTGPSSLAPAPRTK